MLLDAGMSGSSDATSCTPMVLTAERRRLDMYIMLDSNITLPATGVWEKMTAGLGMFVSDSQSNGTGVGIRYFGLTCDAVDYANPSVDVDILPQNASAIMDSIRNRPPWSASPMLPALEGGVMHQRARARRYPEWKEIVVLVSDGFTQDVTCPYTTPDLADAAKEGLVGFPSIETYVIGLGATTSINQQFDELLTRLGAFNQIASAGGSTSAITTGITDGAPAFNAALQRVRRNALPCEYRAPAGVATSEFGVARFPARDVLTRFKNESDCGDSQGWYYAIESLPTPVTMCPATCEWLRESDERQVGIWMGCPTATR